MTAQLNDPTPRNAALASEDGAAGRSPVLESLSGLKKAPSGAKTADKRDYVDRQPRGRRGWWRLDDLSPKMVRFEPDVVQSSTARRSRALTHSRRARCSKRTRPFRKTCSRGRRPPQS
jgi:hypothetical protein